MEFVNNELLPFVWLIIYSGLLLLILIHTHMLKYIRRAATMMWFMVGMRTVSIQPEHTRPCRHVCTIRCSHPGLRVQQHSIQWPLAIIWGNDNSNTNRAATPPSQSHSPVHWHDAGTTHNQTIYQISNWSECHVTGANRQLTADSIYYKSAYTVVADWLRIPYHTTSIYLHRICWIRIPLWILYVLGFVLRMQLTQVQLKNVSIFFTYAKNKINKALGQPMRIAYHEGQNFDVMCVCAVVGRASECALAVKPITTEKPNKLKHCVPRGPNEWTQQT